MSKDIPPLLQILGSIDEKKSNLSDDFIEKNYYPYIINRYYSRSISTVLYANLMNQKQNLPKQMQYDFYYYGLPKARRMYKKPDVQESIYLESVKRYFNYSDKKAIEAIKILSKKQLKEIKDKVKTIDEQKPK